MCLRQSLQYVDKMLHFCKKYLPIIIVLLSGNSFMVLAEKPTLLPTFSPLGLPGSLKGKIDIQGHATGNQSVPLVVQFFKPGEIIPTARYEVLTNSNGEFMIERIAAGDYVVAVKNSHTLQVAAALTIGQGTLTNTNFGLLREGDANNDNQITTLDLSVLTQQMGTSQGQPGYQETADFNADGFISILDFSLLAGNFNQQGYIVTRDSFDELSA